MNNREQKAAILRMLGDAQGAEWLLLSRCPNCGAADPELGSNLERIEHFRSGLCGPCQRRQHEESNSDLPIETDQSLEERSK